MANTYEAIATVTVGSGGAADITFSSIPGTYTDLCLLVSGRGTAAQQSIQINFNGDNTDANYSQKRIQANGSTVGSYGTYGKAAGVAGENNMTASTFGNTSIYIPNYTSSVAKSYSSDGVNENNSTTAYIEPTAGLYTGTSAITSIKIFLDGGNYAQYSTATLYGIKNS